MNTRSHASLASLLGLALLGGCSSAPRTPDAAVNPSLAKLSVPADATPADADRAALSRFVGVWNFEGVVVGADNKTSDVAGNAAAAIEKEHFVLLELRPTSGQMGGRPARTGGAILLGSEPGIGLTATAWGDASPAVSRMTGTTRLGGGIFSFSELRTPTNTPRISLTITFETNDRWVAVVNDVSKYAKPMLARYTFSRAK